MASRYVYVVTVGSVKQILGVFGSAKTCRQVIHHDIASTKFYTTPQQKELFLKRVEELSKFKGRKYIAIISSTGLSIPGTNRPITKRYTVTKVQLNRFR